jgi:hypothetical protein
MAQRPFRQSRASAKPFTVTPNKNDRLIHTKRFPALAIIRARRRSYFFAKFEEAESRVVKKTANQSLCILKKEHLMKI